MSDQPFDKGFHDAVMAKAGELTLSPGGHHIATVVAEIAARIAAERVAVQVAPEGVSDEDLLAIFHAASESAMVQYAREHMGIPDWKPATRQQYSDSCYMAGIRAVRAALGPPVPVIPEESFDIHLEFVEFDDYTGHKSFWSCWLNEEHRGTGPTWLDALTDACEAANQVDDDPETKKVRIAPG